MIPRFDARLVADVCGNKDVVMREAYDGLFVRYEDHEKVVALQAQQISELMEENAALKRPVTQREVIMASGNSQPQSPMQVASVCFNIISARSREAQPREEESK